PSLWSFVTSLASHVAGAPNQTPITPNLKSRVEPRPKFAVAPNSVAADYKDPKSGNLALCSFSAAMSHAKWTALARFSIVSSRVASREGRQVDKRRVGIRARDLNASGRGNLHVKSEPTRSPTADRPIRGNRSSSRIGFVTVFGFGHRQTPLDTERHGSLRSF